MGEHLDFCGASCYPVTVLLTGPGAHATSPPPRQDAQAGLATSEPLTAGPSLVSTLGHCPHGWDFWVPSGNHIPPAVGPVPALRSVASLFLSERAGRSGRPHLKAP